MQQQPSLSWRLGRLDECADPADVAEDELGDVEVHVIIARGKESHAPRDRIAVGDVDLAGEAEPDGIERARNHELSVREHGVRTEKPIDQIVDVHSLTSQCGTEVVTPVRKRHSYSKLPLKTVYLIG
jgi:hypothetical protein